MASLPDMEAILCCVANHQYRSSLDGQDAYEQIHIITEHVHRSAFGTPDGNMESLVMQQGDCNACATFQTLLNHLFGQYIGVWMDVYLDDIIIYSNSLEDHIKYCKIVINILQREKLFLSRDKLRFLSSKMKILGRIIDDQGIRMDPDKVDKVINRKVPINRNLLHGFLGAVGYLVDNIAGVHIPMGVLHGLTGDTVSYHWGPTEQLLRPCQTPIILRSPLLQYADLRILQCPLLHFTRLRNPLL